MRERSNMDKMRVIILSLLWILCEGNINFWVFEKFYVTPDHVCGCFKFYFWFQIFNSLKQAAQLPRSNQHTLRNKWLLSFLKRTLAEKAWFPPCVNQVVNRWIRHQVLSRLIWHQQESIQQLQYNLTQHKQHQTNNLAVAHPQTL